MKKKQSYNLTTIKKTYSYWAKKPILYRIQAGMSTRLRKKAVNMLKIRKGDTILDLACGPGITFKHLQKKIGLKGKIIGLDYVQEMISQSKKYAKKKKWENIKLIKADAAKKKLRKNTIDGIISIIGLSAIPNHEQTIKNCYKALKKGRKMVVLDGKNFDKKMKWLNPILNLVRDPETYEQKDIITSLKKTFDKVKIKEYYYGSVFIATATK